MIRGAVILLTTSLFLVLFFGPIASALNPLFNAVQQNAAVQSSSVVGPSIIKELRTVIFVFVPLIVGVGGVVITFLLAIRLRGTSGVRP